MGHGYRQSQLFENRIRLHAGRLPVACDPNALSIFDQPQEKGLPTMEADTQATEGTVLNVPITKGKGTIAINTKDIPDDVYNEVVLQGLKVLMNRGMSK